MKGIINTWLLAGATAVTVFLTGCAMHSHAEYDHDDYHHHRWAHREYRHNYVGRPPGYYEGSGVDVYVGPEPAPVPRKW